jgi:hypothetical protein
VRAARHDQHPESNVRDAEEALARAQADLDAALRVLADFSDEAGARDRLEELRAERDAAQERLEQLGGGAVIAVKITDWETATLAERRALIRATVESVTVAPGRGTGRITVKLLGQ